MALVEKWKKMDSLNLASVIYGSLIKRFEVLSGREFSSKVISFSAYSAVKNFLEKEKTDQPDLEDFLKGVVKMTVGGTVCRIDMRKESGGVVQIKGCMESETYGPANAGTCYLTAGIVKAVAEKIIGSPVEVKERKCTSLGDDFCEHAIFITR